MSMHITCAGIVFNQQVSRLLPPARTNNPIELGPIVSSWISLAYKLLGLKASRFVSLNLLTQVRVIVALVPRLCGLAH